jgi:protein-S-isoprenylcysteine O-methyltransferase Ste14
MTTTLWLLRETFAQLIVIFYPGVFVYWMIVHNNVSRLRTWGTRAFWVAVPAWVVTSVPLLFFRRNIFSVRWDFPDWVEGVLAVVGIFAIVLAAALLLQAGQQIPFRTLVGFPEIAPETNRQPILSSGIYSRTRNPVYLAHWLVVFSAAALTNFAANWIGFALDCAVLPLLIHGEERELLTRYGDEFVSYMRRVPRFFPRLL